MAKVRTNKNICLNCFGDLDSSRVCVSCHKKADDTPALPHHLPQRAVLNDKYLIAKSLGEGGFGITYLAWDLTQGIKVAIKEYFPSGYVSREPRSNQVIINDKQNQTNSNRGLKRFIDEAKTLTKIKNLSGIVCVRDFFSANNTAYIVMEFLDGISLKKYLQRKGNKIPCDEILTILRPIMDSLIQVHSIGLIHRDISPDNIIITKYNEVKLIDFGAAKQSNMDGKSLSIVLKQGFAPEEQYRTHGEQGAWTDIYALGVTIYYAITGALPPESIQRMYKDTIIKPSEKGAIISPSQETALMKALAVYAKHRYQDVTQLINGLYNTRIRAPKPTENLPDHPTLSTSIASTKSIKKTNTKPTIKMSDTNPTIKTAETNPTIKMSDTKPTPTPTENIKPKPTSNENIKPNPTQKPTKEQSFKAPPTNKADVKRKPTLLEKLFGIKRK